MEATVNLVEKVGGVLEEVNQEISDIMARLKEKSQNNEMFDKQLCKSLFSQKIFEGQCVVITL